LAALVLSLQCEILGAIDGAPDRLSDDAVRAVQPISGSDSRITWVALFFVEIWPIVTIKIGKTIIKSLAQSLGL
jgi:hypothetical protein